MASIHKRNCGAATSFGSSHGREGERIRMKAGGTRQEAEATLLCSGAGWPFKERHHRDSLEKASASYEEYLRVNRRRGTARRSCAF